MIILIEILRRKPGMTVEDFQRYWLDNHAAKVKQLPGLRRYVQSHTLLSGYAKRTPVCDGVAELGFDSIEAVRELTAGPALNAVKQDREVFADTTSRIEILTGEVVIKNGAIPAGGVKNIELVRKRRDMPADAFHRYWIDVHGPLGASIPQVTRYVQSHTDVAEYDARQAPALDGVALTWFTGTDAMRDAARTEEYRRTRDDEENFLTVPLDFVITKEHVILD